MPPLPLTQLDNRAQSPDLDNRAFSLTFAQPVAINDVLLLLVRGTNLSVVPDPSIGGSFIGDLKAVTIRQALGLILRPLGLDFTVDGGVIHVFRREPETRLFAADYLAAERTGDASIGIDPAARANGSYARVTTSVKGDVFADIAKGVQGLLSNRGTFNVDRKAGLVQVTDFPERLDRVGAYLEAVSDRVLRQVQIEARIVEVELAREQGCDARLDGAEADERQRAGDGRARRAGRGDHPRRAAARGPEQRACNRPDRRGHASPLRRRSPRTASSR